MVCSLSTRLYFIIKYVSNIGAVSGYHRVEVVTKFEKLVVAVIDSAGFFATAILLVSAIVPFVLVIVAIVITAVITAAAAVLLVVTAVAVTVMSMSVAAVATVALRVDFVHRSRFLLFVQY